jgi:hypothetical protein
MQKEKIQKMAILVFWNDLKLHSKKGKDSCINYILFVNVFFV